MAKRNDNSGFLYHWIKADPFMKDSRLDYPAAFKVLTEIIDAGVIRAGITMDKGGHECICFTESTKYTITDDTSKYQPFGFQLSKRRVFLVGGRPVIYSPIAEKRLLDESIHWRFMPFDLDVKPGGAPFGIDFSWEREWRLNEPELSLLDVDKIYVPSEKYRELLMEHTSNIVRKSISDYWGGYPDPNLSDYIDDIDKRIDVIKID